MRLAKRNNLKIILWSVDPKEYQTNITIDEILAILKSNIKPNSIVLSHDTNIKTLMVLPNLLDYLEKNNYRIVKISARI